MAGKKIKSNAWITWVTVIVMVVILALMWHSEDILARWQEKREQTDGAIQSTVQAAQMPQSSTAKTDTRQSQQSQQSAQSSQQTAVTAEQLKETVVREPLVTLKGSGKDKVTVLVYMNGSDLETQDGEATADLGEMVAAGSGGNVTVVAETLSTKRWKSTYGISSRTAQRYEVTGKGLKLVTDDLGDLQVGEAKNLTDFIQWGAKQYPADRYILVLWDHGAGPVYGYGYNDRNGSEDTLTAYEMREAIRDAGVTFDIIGMDCCIMASLEQCCALYDFCDYTILSEDFESGYGWYYTGWLKALRENSSISSTELGKLIVDGTISANSRHRQNSILALIDEAYMKALYTAWVNFAYANEDTLIGTNYSRVRSRFSGGRISPVLEANGYFRQADKAGYTGSNLESYFVTDIMSVAQNVPGEEAEVLTAALSHAVVYMNAYGESANLTGLAVTLPYGDRLFYRELKQVFTDCGFDSDYIAWLEKFVSTGGSSSYYDYDDWDYEWSQGGWDDYYDDYGGSGFDWLFGLLGGYDDYGYDDYGYDDYDDWYDGWGGYGWAGW